MYTLNELIADLEIIRDNQQCGVTSIFVQTKGEALVVRGISGGCGPDIQPVVLSTMGRSRPNHTREIDARIADDLRKFTFATKSFREAASRFAQSKNKRYDPDDPERFKRQYRELQETWKDLRHIAQHMGVE